MYIQIPIYSKTCVKRPLSKWQKIGFQDRANLKNIFVSPYSSLFYRYGSVAFFF